MTATEAGGSPYREFVPVLLRTIADRRIGLRTLADRTGLAKSRLGTLLHTDPAKRGRMTIVEAQMILEGLGIDLLEMVARADGLDELDAESDAIYGPVVRMMCAIFRGLTPELIGALEGIDDMDGTEVRPEWAAALRRALIKRVVDEINAVARRRRAIIEFNL